MGDWRLAPLGSIAKVSAGNSAPQEKSLFTGGTHPFIRTSDVGRIRFGVLNSSADYLNDRGIQKLRKFPKGTILFPKSGASTFLNHRVMMGIDGYVASHLATIQANQDSVFPPYLLYFLHTVQSQDLVQDHNYPSLNLPVIESIPIPLPPLAEQERIVAILDEAFAAIATATANAELNLIHARELFESKLNSIDFPKQPLGDLVEIKTGKLNANAAVEDGEYPFFTCSRETFKIDNYAFDCEAILLAGNNASADFNVKHYKGKFNAYQRTYVITVNGEAQILYRFLYYQLLRSLKELKGNAVGAGTKFLKLGIIQDLGICLPSLEVQESILSELEEVEADSERIRDLYQKKIQLLSALKQSLLQQAFTGALTADPKAAGRALAEAGV